MSIRFSVVLSAFAVLICGGNAVAEGWPKQPVKIVVGLAAGGLTDTIARIVAQPMSERLGQPVVIENRPGAAGTIAAEAVAHAPPDGYTLVMGNLPQMVIIPAMQGTRYDPVKDFAPISIVGSNPFVLCINPALPVRTLAEFVEYVRARPGQLSFGSGGIGNGTHLSMAYFLKLAGLEMIHVPYKGGAPAMADVVAGHIPAMFASSSDALPQVRGGTVRAIAITSDERSSKLSEVPTVAEQGFAQFKTITWNGLMAPAQTPPAVVDRLADEVARALALPAVAEQLSKQGIDPGGKGPQAFADSIRSDVRLWTEAVNAAGAGSR